MATFFCQISSYSFSWAFLPRPEFGTSKNLFDLVLHGATHGGHTTKTFVLFSRRKSDCKFSSRQAKHQLKLELKIAASGRGRANKFGVNFCSAAYRISLYLKKHFPQCHDKAEKWVVTLQLFLSSGQEKLSKNWARFAPLAYRFYSIE